MDGKRQRGRKMVAEDEGEDKREGLKRKEEEQTKGGEKKR